MDEREKYENMEIPIDIFESTQIDFKPEKAKKRRKYDDYDYNDPFLESFEGEFEAVELECKLENFFIYKGKIEEDPKRIARRYNNSLKKNPLAETIQNTIQKDNEDKKKKLHFDFEKRLINSVNPSYKYKKDPKFDNFIFWVIYNEKPKSDFGISLRHKLLSFYNHKEFGKDLESQLDNPVEIENLKKEVEERFQEMQTKVSLDSSFSEDKKSFKLFTERNFVEKMISFVISYMKFYTVSTEEKISHVKNTALDFLSAMLPEQCTNGIKVKHYISKVISFMIEENEYDLDSVKNGNFVKISDLSLCDQSTNSVNFSSKIQNIEGNGEASLQSMNKNSLSLPFNKQLSSIFENHDCKSLDFAITDSNTSLNDSLDVFNESTTENTKAFLNKENNVHQDEKVHENTHNDPIVHPIFKKSETATINEEKPKYQNLTGKSLNEEKNNNSNLNIESISKAVASNDPKKSVENEDSSKKLDSSIEIPAKTKKRAQTNTNSKVTKPEENKNLLNVNKPLSKASTSNRPLIANGKIKTFSYPTVPVFDSPFANKTPSKAIAPQKVCNTKFEDNTQAILASYPNPTDSISLGSSAFETENTPIHSREEIRTANSNATELENKKLCETAENTNSSFYLNSLSADVTEAKPVDGNKLTVIDKPVVLENQNQQSQTKTVKKRKNPASDTPKNSKKVKNTIQLDYSKANNQTGLNSSSMLYNTTDDFSISAIENYNKLIPSEFVSQKNTDFNSHLNDIQLEAKPTTASTGNLDSQTVVSSSNLLDESGKNLQSQTLTENKNLDMAIEKDKQETVNNPINSNDQKKKRGRKKKTIDTSGKQEA